MMISAEDLAKLEADHKRVALVKSFDKTPDGEPEWCVVYKKPNRGQYKQFRSRINNESLAPDATEQLARALVVYPSPEAFDALLEEWPAIPEASSKALLRLMGMAAEPDLK